MVITRCRWLTRPARALRSVVLPAPVPPLTTRLAPLSTNSSSRDTTGGPANISRATSGTTKRRIVTYGPSTATGGTATWTREPSGRRPSTQGVS